MALSSVQRPGKRRQQQVLNLRPAQDEEDVVPSPSTLPPPAPTQSPTLQEADGISLLARVDSFAGLRQSLREIAEQREDSWAGIPIPLAGLPLILCPKYPNAEILSSIDPEPEIPEKFKNVKIRNEFYSTRHRIKVVVYTRPNGHVSWGWVSAYHSLHTLVQTMEASVAWGLEQEAKALKYLADLLPHWKFKQYLLVGVFTEQSKRTGFTYIFRKLRPTVVIDARGKDSTSVLRYRIGDTAGTWKEEEDALVRCALCLHPIGYYEGSWAGAMCPTDDVIAHLLMMRGDEVMFWRKANQIPAHLPTAGL